ncbi:MAG: substrate-binding domain-containing protein [Spirochaetales bacterium]|nr:substrate-binding domain-containing protein [Spirochaetales bacterium]
MDSYNYSDGRKPLLWMRGRKSIPPRPDDPFSFPESDRRHWFDSEFPGWQVRKSNIPESPMDGAKGKRIICLLPEHPYHTEYEAGMKETAEPFGIELEFKHSGWDMGMQAQQVAEVISARPDMVIFIPESASESVSCYRQINEAGIPVIASNLVPDPEAFRYILAWTGPDDWGQFRMLARRFAERLDFRGGYAVICHIPGSSAFLGRKWGLITELNEIAPRMKLLGVESTGLDKEQTYRQVKKWIEEFGVELKGIVSADDNIAQQGINRALEEAGRTDIVRVANGSSRVGMRMLKNGTLDVATYQSARLDGALAIQLAIDWFNGLDVEPFRYLPIQMLTAENVDGFLLDYDEPEEIDLDRLYQLVLECNRKSVELFFSETYHNFTKRKIISEEYFRGFAIEVLSNLLNIIKTNGLAEQEIVGGYESIFKKLFQHKTIEKTLDWLKQVSLEIIFRLSEKESRPQTLIQQIVEYVDQNYTKPMSLKVLGYQFDLSPAYLGKLFKEQTGDNYSRYLNNLRITQAKKLLRTSGMKANQIALEVGYTDPNYFYNTFKKYTGVYPSEYNPQ